MAILSLTACGNSLTHGHALAACKRKASIEAPQGFDYDLGNVDITDNDDDTVTIVFNNATINKSLTQTIRCDVGGTNDNPSVLSFGSVSGNSDASVGSVGIDEEGIREQYGNGSNQSTFISPSISLENGVLHIDSTSEPFYWPLVTVADVNGQEATVMFVGQHGADVSKPDGTQSNIPGSSYVFEMNEQNNNHLVADIDLIEDLGICSKVQTISVGAYSQDKKKVWDTSEFNF